ncbi:MAG: hypothetical protein ACI8P0_004927 [Planctomycetaceae bacterium]|jgi:hypothetical protein
MYSRGSLNLHAGLSLSSVRETRSEKQMARLNNPHPPRFPDFVMIAVGGDRSDSFPWPGTSKMPLPFSEKSSA